jgi:hypothetical protein
MGRLGCSNITDSSSIKISPSRWRRNAKIAWSTICGLHLVPVSRDRQVTVHGKRGQVECRKTVGF